MPHTAPDWAIAMPTLSGVSAKMIDYDNDGWVDIFQANGAMLDNISTIPRGDLLEGAQANGPQPGRREV